MLQWIDNVVNSCTAAVLPAGLRLSTHASSVLMWRSTTRCLGRTLRKQQRCSQQVRLAKLCTHPHLGMPVRGAACSTLCHSALKAAHRVAGGVSYVVYPPAWTIGGRGCHMGYKGVQRTLCGLLPHAGVVDHALNLHQHTQNIVHELRVGGNHFGLVQMLTQPGRQVMPGSPWYLMVAPD